jgi:hypothetical protein
MGLLFTSELGGDKCEKKGESEDRDKGPPRKHDEQAEEVCVTQSGEFDQRSS